MDFQKRRQEIIDHHVGATKHNPAFKNLPAGEQPYPDRPIAFLCDDEVVVVGECVGKIYAGLRKFDQMVEQDKESWSARAAREPWVGQAIAKVKKLLASPEQAEIRSHQQVWNGYMFAMGEVGLQVVLTDGTYETPLS